METMNNSILKIMVYLYRIAGKPAVQGMYLPLKLSYSLEVDELIRQLLNSKQFNRYVEQIEFDGLSNDVSEVPENWDALSISLKLPRDNVSRFHPSVNDLIGFSSLRNGDFPNDFYIIDLDYYTSDIVKPEPIIKIENICRLIKSLSKLAHYHDRKSTDGEPRLVFIQGADGRSKSAIIQPTIQAEMLEMEDFDCRIVEQLQEELSSEDVNHHVEKRGIFRNTIVEFINENNFKFIDLVKNWTDFRLAYDNNLSVYLSGFNFHKARKDVASAELEFAEKISKTLSELTAKILAIPVSILAALGILKLNDVADQLVVFFGVLVTSIAIHLLIMSQKKQLARIVHAKSLVFLPFQARLKKYPEDLKKSLEKTLEQLNKNESFAKCVLNAFYFFCWLPTFISIFVIIYKITKCEE